MTGAKYAIPGCDHMLDLPYVLDIEVDPDCFDIVKIQDSGQVFRWVKSLSRGVYVPAFGHEALINQIAPDTLRILHNGLEEGFWRAYLDLDRDYADLVARFRSLGNPVVNRSLEIASGMVSVNQPFFETAIVSLVSQNNNIPKIARSVSSLCTGRWAAFPSAEQILERLSRDGCSLGYRIEYVRLFCERYLDGAFEDLARLSPADCAYLGKPLADDKPPLETVLDRLEQERGIGPKVANLIALFSLGYADALPVDVWIRRAQDEGVAWVPECAGIEQQFVFYAFTHGLWEELHPPILDEEDE